MTAEPAKAPTLVTQAAWLMIAKIVGFAFAFFLPLVLARMMNQSEYGLYKQAFLLVSTLQMTLPLSVGMSAFYFFARMPERGPFVVMNILIYFAIAGGAAGLALALFPQLLTLFFGGSELVPLAGLLGAVVFLRVFSSFLEVVATAGQDVSWSTIFIIMAQFTRSALMLMAALHSASIEWLLYASLVQGLIQLAILLWYLQKRYPGFWKSFDRALFGEQISYSLPIGAGLIAVNLQSDLHSYFVAHKVSDAAFAIYAVGCMQVPLISLLRDSIGSVLIGRVSALQHQGRRDDIVALMAKSVRTLAGVYWPAYALLLVVGYDLLVMLYTSTYVASWPIFAVNLGLVPLNIVVNDAILRAYAAHRYFLIWMRIWILAATAAALYFGVEAFGMQGAILIAVGAIALDTLLFTLKVARILDIRRDELPMFADVLWFGGAAAIAGIAAAASRHALPPMNPFVLISVTGSVFMAVYIASVLLMRILQPGEIAMVTDRLRGITRRFLPEREDAVRY